MKAIGELLGLLDRLDNLIFEAKPIPLSDQVRVDKEVIYDLLDEMRVVLGEARNEPPQTPEQRAPAKLPAVSVGEASATLSALLHRVRFGGEAIVIELGGQPMAELRPPREG